MVTISLCMIVKNEERVLGRCLESVQEIADEIIIVDTGSEDRTKKIAEKYHARVFEQEWQDDFSRGTILFLRQRWTTVCGLMQMILLRKVKC